MENARAVLRRLYGVGTTVLITSSVLPRTGGREATKPIQVVVGGPSIEVLRELSGTAAKVLQAIPGVVEVSSSLGVPSPEARIVVDPDRAEALGLDPARVARDLPVYVAGKRATSWQGPSGDERAVIVRLPEADRKSLPTLDELPLPIGPGLAASNVSRVRRSWASIRGLVCDFPARRNSTRLASGAHTINSQRPAPK